MLAIRTILHPTDFSESAEAAFSVAGMLAKAHKARLIVLHVYPLPISRGEGVDYPPDQAEMWRLLDRYYVPDPDVHVDDRLAEGSAPEEILRVAEEEGCDLIVMGTQGRTGLARLLMGSVAEKVMRGAHCPVLTVRIPPGWSRTVSEKQEVAAV
jgi:nucleotide-binding universal stress UspA family protein